MSNKRPMTVPGRLTAKVEGNSGYSAKITWEEPAIKLDAYKVKWWHKADEVYLQTIQVSTYTVSGLVHGRTYMFQVAGENDAGIGDYSEIVAFDSAPLPPNKIESTPGTAEQGSIIIVKFEDPNEKANKYRVTARNLTTGREQFEDTEDTCCCMKDLENGSMYQVYVHCVVVGPSIEERKSRPAFCSELVRTVPGIVVAEVAEESPNTIKWEPVIGADFYEIGLKPLDGNYTFSRTNETEYTVENIERGKAHFLHVRAVNDTGKGERSDVLPVKLAPRAPTNILLKHCDQSPETELLVAFRDTNKDETTFEIFATSLSHGEEKFPSNQLHGVLTGLTPGESYSISVEAIQGDLRSERSYHDGFVQTYPTSPKIQNPEIVNKRKIKYSWSNLEIAPMHYEFAWTSDGVNSKTVTTQSNFFIIDAEACTTYKASLVAVNMAGKSKTALFDSIVTGPDSPMNVSVFNTDFNKDTTLRVTFEDSNTKEKEYEIVAKPFTGGDEKRKITGEKSVFMTDLTPGESYDVYVVAIYAGKRSAHAPFE